MAFGYQDFFAALRQRESSGNYKLVNSYGYLGAYQFGEGALVDLGFVNNDGKWWDNDFSGGWTGSHGIDSKAEFLSTPTAQDTAAAAWFPLLWTYLTDLNADDWLGKTIAGIEISASGLIAGAHLLGAGSVVDWLESGGKLALSDAYGTPISEYIGKFSGYSLPFVSETTKAQFLSSAIASFSDGIQNQIQTILDANGKFKIGSDGVNDRLSGASGHDVLAGGSGNDTLVGRRWRHMTTFNDARWIAAYIPVR
jgi:Ca2+-binding RTX toxin-like protein